MRAKRFFAGDRVIVSIDDSPYLGDISRRLDEAGKYWQVRLDDGRLHDADACDVKRYREKYVDPTPEEIAERAAEIRAEWPEQLTRQRQVSKPDRLEMRESHLWRRTPEGGLSE